MTTPDTYATRIGLCVDLHLTAAQALAHIARAERDERVEVWRVSDGAACTVEADLDLESLALWCGDDIVALGDPVSDEVLDCWC
jgi:hypothetical protein